MLFQLLHLHMPLHGQTVPKITVSHHHNSGYFHSYRYTDLYPNTGTIIIEMLHFLKKYKLVLWNYLICSSLSNIYFEACICMLLKWTERIAANKQNQGHNFSPFPRPLHQRWTSWHRSRYTRPPPVCWHAHSSWHSPGGTPLSHLPVHNQGTVMIDHVIYNKYIILLRVAT